MAGSPPLSSASGLVLRDLGRADGKEVIKQAIKELVARGVFALEHREVRRALRRPRSRPLLVPTGATPAVDALLTWTQRAVSSAPRESDGVQMAHDLAAVAESIAKDDPKIRKHVVERVLADLEQRGLARSEDHRVVGLFHRTVWTRTPAGDALLDAPPARRRAPRDGGDGATGGAVLWSNGGGGHPDDRDRGGTETSGLDAGLDPSLDPGLDSPFDSSFDSSFDSAFDSSFDSGFSDGGGDGGGGDGGGGDGGGGGGGD